jgi:hypothetical protein
LYFSISDEPCVHQAIDHDIFQLLNTLEGDRNINYVHYTAFPKVMGGPAWWKFVFDRHSQLSHICVTLILIHSLIINIRTLADHQK